MKIIKRKAFRIAIIVLVSTLTVLAILIVFLLNFIFTPEKLTPWLTKMINEKVNATVRIKKVELTFFSTFPNFKLKVTDASLQRKNHYLESPLLAFQECYTSIDLKELYQNNNIDIKDIIINKPFFNIVVDEKGHSNWENLLIDDPNEPENSISYTINSTEIKKILLKNSRINFTDRMRNAIVKSTDFDAELMFMDTKNVTSLRSKIDSRNLDLVIGNYHFSNSVRNSLTTNLGYNKRKNEVYLYKADMNFNSIPISTLGTIKIYTAKKDLEVYSDCKVRITTPLRKEVIELLPKYVTDNYFTRSSSGDIDILFHLKGLYNSTRFPTAYIKVKATGYNLTIPQYVKNVSLLQVDLQSNLNLNNKEQSDLKVNSFHIVANDFNLKGKANVENLLTDQKVKSEVEGNINLWPATKSYTISNKIKIKGNAAFLLNVHFNGSEVIAKNYNNILLSVKSNIDNFDFENETDKVRVSAKKAIFSVDLNSKNVVPLLFNIKGIVGENKNDRYSLASDENKEKIILSGFSNFKNVKYSSQKDSVFASISDARLTFDAKYKRNTLPVALSIDQKQAEGFSLNKILLNGKNKITISGFSGIKDLIFISKKDSVDIKTSSANLKFVMNPANSMPSLASLDMDKSRIVYKTNHISFDKLLLDLKRSDEKGNATDLQIRTDNVFCNLDNQLNGKAQKINFSGLVINKGSNMYVNSKFNIDSASAEKGQQLLEIRNGKYNVDFTQNDDKTWSKNGKVDFSSLVFKTPELKLPVTMSNSGIVFKNKDIQLNDTNIKVGRSDLTVTGSLKNILSDNVSQEQIEGKIYLRSSFIDANEFMSSISMENDSNVTSVENLPSDSTESFKLPSNLNIDFDSRIKEIQYGNLNLKEIGGNIVIDKDNLRLKEVGFRLLDTEVVTTANYFVENHKPKFNFDILFKNANFANIPQLMPSMESFLKMTESLEGKADMRVQAQADLDSSMNIVPKTLVGILAIRAKDIRIENNEIFRALSKKMMLKNQKSVVIDNLGIEALIERDQIHLLPTILNIDRYSLVFGGYQYYDSSYSFHLSVLKSPVPFKLGFDITGKDYDSIKLKLTRAKYKYYFTDKERLLEKADESINQKKQMIINSLKSAL